MYRQIVKEIIKFVTKTLKQKIIAPGQTAYYCRSTEGFKRKVAPLAGAVRIATPAVIPAVIVITLSIC